MEKFTKLIHIVLVLVISLMALVTPINGQSSNGPSASLCTGPMMRSFGPCLGFLVIGSNSSSPTSACCNSLRDLMRNGQDCLCLIVTGGAPFQVPINRSLAINLPRSCRSSVPIECRDTGGASPVPAPDPQTRGGGGSNLSPGLSPPSPRAPFIPQPFTPPSFSPPSSIPGGNGGLTPPGGDVVPTLTPPGMRPTLTPSAAQTYHSALPSVLAAALAVILLHCY